jgi:methionine-rich copper-binding protein CopC
VVGPGTGTHSLTLYRAPSGALVFGAGTVQWSWGLDGNHNDGTGTPDINIEQATVNLLANMYAQPATLQPGLVAAKPSTAVTPPTSVITSPSAGASFAIGSTVTITGTATAASGSVVAGVEVSVDSGRTWHPAVGRTSWSYTWVPDAPGPWNILSRAVDDSGNIETPSAGVAVTAFYQPTSTANLVAAYGFNEGSGTTVHDASGHGNTGTISGATWVNNGVFGDKALSFNGTNSWVTIPDSSSLHLTSGMTLEAWVDPTAASTGYTAVMIKERTNGLAYGLYASDGAGQPPGAYVDKSGTDYNADGLASLPLNTWTFLTGTYDGTTLNIYVNGTLASSQSVGGNIMSSTGALRIGGDSIWGEYFQGLIDSIRIYNAPLNQGQIRADMNTPADSTQVETTPPTVSLASPTSGASVAGVTTLTANASDDVAVYSVQFLLNGSFLGSRLFSAPYTFNWDTRAVPNGTYTLAARAKDSAGNVATSSSITVTVNNPADTTPPIITLLNPSNGGLLAGTIVPWAVASDNVQVASVQFQVDGVNLGAAETASPYRIAWNSTTVADGTHTLTAIATDAAGNRTTSNAATVTIENTPPAVTGTTPANGATGVLTTLSSLTATLNMAVQPSTISFVLATSTGSTVPGTISFDASSNVVTFTLAGNLAPTTTYTATLSNAQNLAGSLMAPFSWSFTTTSIISGATIWARSATPSNPSTANDPNAIELGVKFRSDVAGYITGIRFYKGTGNTGTHVGHLWTSTGTLLTTVTFTNETATGWQEADFATAVAIAANTTYVASYLAPAGHYAGDSGYFASSGVDSGVLHALSNSAGGGDGVYLYGSSGGFPSSSFNATNYWVDVVFGTTPTNTTPPNVVATTPAAGATGVSTTSPNVTATFSKPVQPATVSFVLTAPNGTAVPASLNYNSTTQTEALTPSVGLAATTTYTATVSGAQDLNGIAMTSPFSWTFTTAAPDTTPPAVATTTPAAGATTVSLDTTVTATFTKPVQGSTIAFTLTGPGGAVAATLTYNSSTNTATLTPSAPLAVSTTYTATVSGATDLAGNTMTGPATWSFTTAPLITGATIWPSSATPATPAANDSTAVELGVKFRSDVDGYITGIRFYKGSGNTGTHVGYLWTATGALLTSAIFSNESATGWQQVNFATPVAIQANTTYVASYLAPAGHYAVSGGYFTSAGADNGVLHALSNTAGSGNGVYLYGSSGGFPTNSHNATNYWVDVVFSDAPNSAPPTVVATTPAAGTTNVSFDATLNATFNEAVQLSTVSFVLKDPLGTPVAATVASEVDQANTLILTPHALLAPSTTYTATVSGAQSLNGVGMTSPVTWSFTTAPAVTGATIWSSTVIPGTPSINDSGAVELGVKFRTDADGYITGIRFYKGAGNTGTHIGHLWDASGNLLATATFSNETATGWQQVSFASPVAIMANTTYIASYFAPNGHYAGDGGYFATSGVDNGLLHALSNSAGGGDGVYVYGSSGGFPTSSYNATNYWVDVVFSDVLNTTPPTVIATTPAAGATGVAPGSTVTATFSESVQSSTISFVLTGANNQVLGSTVSYNDSTHTATLTPVFPMAYSTTYTASLSGAQDLSGNTMAPVSWSFTTSNAWIQTSVSDFNAGTQNGTMVTDTAGGEVSLASSFNDDFDGSALSSAWATTSWAPSGGGPTSVTVSAGILSVAGAEVLSTQTITSTAIEGRVAFGVTPYQHFGMATDFSSVAGNFWAIFSTAGTNNTLFARVNSFGATTDVSLGALPSGFQTYRVQYVSGGFQFLVDGVAQTTIAASFPTGSPIKLAMSAFSGSPQPPLQVDWARVASYPSSGTFTSSVFDAGRTASWGTVSWTANLPAGTTLTVQTSSSTDGVNWSAWSTATNGQTVASPSGRYLRYQVVLTTTDPTLTPTLSDITFLWN